LIDNHPLLVSLLASTTKSAREFPVKGRSEEENIWKMQIFNTS